MSRLLEIGLFLVVLSLAAFVVSCALYWLAQAWWVLQDNAQDGDNPDGGGDYLDEERKRYRS